MENQKENWIKLHRIIKKSEIYPRNRKFTKFEAYIDILLSVNWSDKSVNFLGMEIKLKAGEMATTQRILARRWKWSVSKVNYFIREKKLNTLVNTFMNTYLNTPITKITVNNWKKYQSGIEHLPERLPEHLSEREQEETILKKKLYQRKKIPTPYAVKDFDIFWKEYPKKVGKGDALKAFKKATDKPAVEKLIEIIQRQKQSVNWNKENGQYIPNPTTWLNGGRWDDELTYETGGWRI